MDMQDFSWEALGAALISRTSVCFRHRDLDLLADQLRSERKTLSFKTSGNLASISWIFIHAGEARIRIKEVSEDASTLEEAARLLRAQNYDVPYHGESAPSFVRRCVEAILIWKRRYLSREQERECREAYDNACAKCGSRERLQMDHIRPAGPTRFE